VSQIYLQSVELSNFRLYGDSYAFEFPSEPSVTLITGANGLGKTSFFDGVEWALTNQVSRFSDFKVDGRRREQNPLTRIGASEDSHRVSLAFSEGRPIDRGAGFAPKDGAIAALLKQPNWPSINSLLGYLSITHFLGQTSTRRFSLREPKSQWEALKGPAGVDRINLLREKITGQGVRLAFARALREETASLERALSDLEAWQQLLADRARLTRLSNSERAISPPKIIDEVNRLILSAMTWAPEGSFKMVDADDDAEQGLTHLAALLTRLEESYTTAEARASALEQLVKDWQSATVNLNARSQVAREINERQDKQLKQLTVLEADLSAKVGEQSQFQQLAALAAARVSTLAKVAEALEQTARSARIISDTARQLEISRTESEAAERRLKTAQEEVEKSVAIRSARSRAFERLASVQTWVEVSGRILQAREEIERLNALVDANDGSSLRSTREAVVKSIKEAAAETERITAELRSHDDRARTFNEAVSLIAHQLVHEDTTCPVCKSTFDPGQLKELSLLGASISIGSAADLAEAFRTSKTREADLALQASQLARAIAEHDGLIEALSQERARESGLVLELMNAGGDIHENYEDSLINEARQELALLDDQIDEMPSREVLEAGPINALADIKAQRVAQLSLERQMSDAMSEAGIARSVLSQYPDLWSAELGMLVSLADEQQAAQNEARSLESKLGEMRVQVDEIMRSRDSAAASVAHDRNALAQTNYELSRLSELQQSIAKRWLDAGEHGDPSQDGITQLTSRIAEGKVRLGMIATAHGDLMRGFRTWLSDQQLQQRESLVAATLAQREADSATAATRLFEQDVAQARRRLELVQKTKNRMETLGSIMREQVEEFADDVLKPLNETIKRFARPLMTWSDESIIYHAEHHSNRSSELRPSIARTAPDGTTTQLEMNPNLYFSEGQLSALSVSALLAASTTFSWSKWRALLLDDPLQHNDVIHASAFMDLLRQMVRELGYQVILSTHDTSEAEFLIRKCRSAGIKFTVHELAPRGEEGLVSAVA
jgi:DNA repair exonuclease SbcCD ATPase subunit